MRARQFLTVLPAVVAAATLCAPAVANAAPASAPTSGRHCVLQLTPAARSHPSGVVARQCFASLAKAIAVATSGAVRLPADASIGQADKALKRAPVVMRADSTWVIGIEYKNAGFGGASFTFTGSSTCTGSVQYNIPNTHRYGFGDNISAARTYANCAGVHYENKNYGGDSVYVYGSLSNFGAMNDKTSSIQFF